ncbi:cyclin-dependent kinase inhibitor 1Bb [Pimephales promelas]|uniref:cyclin-dependent kinase inhibitor 1Bb n=1 Tax=Pimephales promelas TaxID=90988 RepID=UPI0019555B09|nr:cyclin-dependent kinase inhibitor 1Bb [Pimephales promelas]KAG1938373.1 cyclin-dependent kinase inhibitor [Pimephales promelas]
MSNVRLSNGSPTLERMEARVSDQPKPSACRNLFGPVDHEELKKDFQRHLKAMEDASTDAWNFDFSTHTPRADGRFQWEALDIRSVPGFYSRSERGKGSNLHMCSSGNNNDNNVDVNGNHECRVTEETPETPREPRKRPSCLDSSCQSKHSHICVDEVTRTPRKPKKPRKHPNPTTPT